MPLDPPASEHLPTRADVEARWEGLIDGIMARGQVHEWAAIWIEGEDFTHIPDAMVRNGLQHLHGYDLARNPDNPELIRHSLDGDFLRSINEIRSELEEWRSNCLVYDQDPSEYARSARQHALDALRRRNSGSTDSD